ncbi:nucleotidyltransferase domain-containing protein [Candidatus Woesearchaeota archaeon]|nr:nucleotidyltransferase domain-containing protein [Candidatus Woesearchaeota archaeon]
MINQELRTRLEPILSNKEIEVVLKRLQNKHITQTESNYLSRSVRPKLRSAEFAASSGLLSLLGYRRKKYERNDRLLREKVVKSVGANIKDVQAIILFGSYVRNGHTDYRDIDVMIVVRKKLWKGLAEKRRLEANIERGIDARTDINLVDYGELRNILPYSPLLQTELEDHKLIYGDIALKEKVIIDRAYLYRKLLETEYVLELGRKIRPRYVYNAMRNCLSIKLFLKGVIGNKQIIKTIEDNIGRSTAESLMEDKSDSLQRDIALKYLEYLYNGLMESLKDEQKRAA